jgi:Uma2 family endonuclease
MAVTTNKLMTWQEFAALPDDGQYRELVRGEVITMPPAHTNHGYYGSNILIPLGAHVKTERLGRAYNAETGYLLESAPDTVRSPDVSFVAAARSPAVLKDGEYFRGAPDFLAEVVSTHDKVFDVEEKTESWLAGGARLVWVVNPRRKSVEVHRAGVEPQTFRVGEMLDATDVVPGFTLPVAAIFE